MAAGSLMSKQVLQQRLLVTIPRPGRPRVQTTELRIADIALWLGVGKAVLVRCAHKQREVDDSLQVQLSSFFSLIDRELIVKVKRGDAYVLERRALPPGQKEPPRATIDISGPAPRVNWS